MSSETEAEQQEAPKENVLPELELKRLLEIAEFSNVIEEVNTKITEYHARIATLKTGLDALLEALPVLVAELDRLDELERRVLELVSHKLEK